MNAAATAAEHSAPKPRKGASQPLDAAALPDALLKVQTVAAVTGLSASSIFRKLAARQFPEPVRLGARCTRWKSADLRAWMAAQTTQAEA